MSECVCVYGGLGGGEMQQPRMKGCSNNSMTKVF